ncbi:MAG TPA: NUDIX hydrolase [Rhizomicrobium sp.]|jgi:8-oxo-dGTP pyrophosphatase MutT (NUDIX family)|nr:NUDIX hydrolase [Rhizomicrobium sp.]
MSSVALQAPNVNLQYAALPWRKVHGHLEILLVTTRTSRRWIVPKGWPVSGCKPAECAAREASEEAGVVGEVAAKPLGWFSYDKRLKSGDMLPCKVVVFPMEVMRQRRSWPEKGERQTRWCTIDEALARVPEAGLHRLIAKFGDSVSRAAA